MNGEQPKRRNETAEQRKKRLASELRANLMKRKAKARSQALATEAEIAAVGDGHEGGKQD
jgi:hypothetical protein